MADEKKKRPPYTSGPDIEALFDGIRTKQAPKKLDTAWVESYSLAATQAEAIPSLLKWLRIIDKDGVADPAIWDAVRVPQTRADALEPLVRDAYSELFDRIEVEHADVDDLGATFVLAYGMGDPRRAVRCFLTLCDIAGIETGARPSSATDGGNGAVAAEPKKRKQREAGTPKKQQEQRVDLVQPTKGVILALSVEIPADWSIDQIRDRVLAISQVLSEAENGAA